MRLVGDFIQTTAVDAGLAFCITAIFGGQEVTITALEEQLADEFGSGFPGSALFEQWRGEVTSRSPLDKVCADLIALLRKGEHIESLALWQIGLRLFERIGQSIFEVNVTPILAKWLRTQWRRVIAEERFRVSRALLTLPISKSHLQMRIPTRLSSRRCCWPRRPRFVLL
jgi:hypothetical protein